MSIMDPHQITRQVDNLLEHKRAELNDARKDLRAACCALFDLEDEIQKAQDMGLVFAAYRFEYRRADVERLKMSIAGRRFERHRDFVRLAEHEAAAIKGSMATAEALFFSDDLDELWKACCMATDAEDKYLTLLKGAYQDEN